MLDTFKYENKRGSTYLTEDNVYGAFIEEKTANDAEKGFYGVKKWYHANASPFEKNIATLIGINLISESEVNGKILYKSSIDPIYSEIEERLKSSRDKYNENDYLSVKIVIDSDWFRNLFSYKLMTDSKKFECIREYASINQKISNVRINNKTRPYVVKIEDPLKMARCLMNTIGIVCFSLNGYLVNNNFVPDITAEYIIKLNSFDQVISKTPVQKERIDPLLKHFCGYCKTHCVADSGPNVPDTPMIPNELLKAMVSASPYLSNRICNIFMRMGTRNQLTLLKHYSKAAEIVSDGFTK
ncbi:hypothetical protein [Methanogenium organophilum]|uniref:Uncharacterized protein n=1 Tax=Methanogenium organophilum TaxID=2199 RepID=A0A9X9T7G4_METOG|nr:hypothetical protein [Methanogenium organophilum]WAI01343.1 hypothetical protein OU421_00250 [Methanogenium organophilum]